MSLDRSALSPTDEFHGRHIGPSGVEQEQMLQALGVKTLEALIDQVVPQSLRMSEDLKIPSALTESEALADLEALASQNSVYRSYLGMGYSNTLTPSAILRNVLENPGWYTQYTPYQAEISQGRLEAMLNFQTLVTDLTGLSIANSSLLDEGTAAAEAMTLALRAAGAKSKANVFFASENCHEQTLAVLRTRAEPLGIKVVVGCHKSYDFAEQTFGVLVQYPDTNGTILDYQEFFTKAKAQGAMAVVAADLLSLVLLKAPADFGADVVVGNSQRFGVPLGFGGPHAAFMATHEEHKRRIPGRVVGVSKDAEGRPAMRLALQTREQHIRRDRATSNICTAQVLLAVVASMYAVYHGPEGLKRIARRVLLLTRVLAKALTSLGFELEGDCYFDTLKINKGPKSSADILSAALAKKINLRAYADGAVGIALDETVTTQDLADLVEVFGGSSFDAEATAKGLDSEVVAEFARPGEILTHPVFSKYHSETELMRYVTKLAGRDLSLTHSMIPLGSCTMKLNAATEMIPVTWKAFGGIHPFAPLEQTKGYLELFKRLEAYLAEITGFSAVSLQPNAGSQGEYAGLLAIRGYHQHHNQGSRHICLIPMSAHGTNPASAVMAGMKVVGVRCDDNGNIDVEDLRKKAEKHKDDLAALMVTYPSTHGVFEESIREICTVTHDNGGLVYLDGANMNAMVGLCQPASFGADVCHLNLHKTFCIPHGGGGPGMGPIGVVKRLEPFLPTHPLCKELRDGEGIGAVAAAPWGSPSILPISYSYIVMMGPDGLKDASEVAILNANYIAARLDPHFPVLYRGADGRVAHECIIDLRDLKKTSGVEVEDVAKRLMDYGFHAPTQSWPVAGTLMIEPTESESLAELDRFCEALIAIREEIKRVEDGEWPRNDNPLKNAPHTSTAVAKDEWAHPYSRMEAVFPKEWVKESKFWPAVARIDNVYGDRNLICSCPTMEEATDSAEEAVAAS
ncbi:MAG: aminomethyl-transferring glycine dehydrogenase [Planctomycetota bacterium]|nr:aminomethyl-transferring glycine dehydrogenase [Planctomycetota bacterium]